MRVNRRTALVYLMVLSGLLLWLLLENNDAADTELIFSKESGFYEEPFELELYAPVGTEIFYTLDGSEPNENAIKYMGPINIENVTDKDNVYSLRTDVSAGYLTEDIEIYGTSYPAPGYVVPDYKIDKSVVVRAAYLDADGNFSKIRTESYFVGYDGRPEYEDLNTISIVTDPDNLFDSDRGIYVLGRTYDEYISGNREDYWAASYWNWWKANYHMHGPEWERPASIQIFDTEKKLILNQECGIRIQGGGSRGMLPKSISMYAREEYSEKGRFYIDLFGTGYMADTMTLFAGGDDAISKMRDKVTSELIKGRNFARMNYEPYVMFLDGEYWGVYWLTEKYDDVFLGYYYGVNKDNIIMIKDGDVAEGEERDYKLYEEMMDYMNNTDFSVQENYEYACELMDMQSFIDYFATEIYIGRNGDWPGSNFALWRARNAGDGKYEDGKWRWMLYDVNSGALAEYLTDADTLDGTMKASQMFCNLCQSEDFKKQFTLTFMDLVNTSFTKENVDNVISNCRDLLDEPMTIHFKRFFGLEDNSQFVSEVADIKDFLDHRKTYIVQYLKDDFELEGTLAKIDIEVNNAYAGKVIVNTSEITFDENLQWSGEYYTDYPITLSVFPEQGYRFAGWQNSIVPDKENIVINIGREGISVKAVFEVEEK